VSVVVGAPVLRKRQVWDEATRSARRSAAAAGDLEIGILNNMPDAALRATERQFMDLLGSAPEAGPVRVRLFALPQIARGAEVQDHIAANYADITAMGRRQLDGLIVTGCEPHTADLAAEPFWDSLAAVVDWADAHTRSSIWSCLAAHAAVLHLDGIERRLLPAKRFGVFASAPTGEDALLDGVPAELSVPHARYNDVAEAALRAKGYGILTRSDEAGVDWFVKRRRSTYLFSQGHPEYAADSLLREYRRDVGRFLRGERAAYPDMPRGYFDPATEDALARFAVRALRARSPALLAEFPAEVSPANRWAGAAVPIYRNWLASLRAAKIARAEAHDPEKWGPVFG
jgi:homoserine O-succinyltransferase